MTGKSFAAKSFPTKSFPPAARILKTSEYDYVKNEGTRAYGQWLMVSYAPARTRLRSSPKKPTQTKPIASVALRSRLGIAVTKKVSPRAVDRNQFKRAIKEAFRLISADITSSIDIVVVARRDVTTASTAKLRSEFVSLLKQEGLLD